MIRCIKNIALVVTVRCRVIFMSVGTSFVRNFLRLPNFASGDLSSDFSRNRINKGANKEGSSSNLELITPEVKL